MKIILFLFGKYQKRYQEKYQKIQIYKSHNNKVNYATFNLILDNGLYLCDINNEIHIWNPEKN